MTATKIAVKVPMRKLFAVASFVGAASGTALVVRASTDAGHVREPCGQAPSAALDSIVAPPESSRPSVVVVPAPVIDTPPVIDTTIQPLVLPTGAPACGNVTYKVSFGPSCAEVDPAFEVRMRFVTAQVGTQRVE